MAFWGLFTAPRGSAASAGKTLASKRAQAVVLTPVGSISRNGEDYVLDHNTEPGPTCLDLYTRLTDIQRGDAPDEDGWTHVVVPPS